MCIGGRTTVNNTQQAGAPVQGLGASSGAAALAIGSQVDENGNILLDPRARRNSRQQLKIGSRSNSAGSGSSRGLPGGGSSGSFRGATPSGGRSSTGLGISGGGSRGGSGGVSLNIR